MAAAAYVSYAFTDVAAIFPNHPIVGYGRARGRVGGPGTEKLFGQPVKVVEMQSEGGARRGGTWFASGRRVDRPPIPHLRA